MLGSGVKALYPLNFKGLLKLGYLNLQNNEITTVNSGDFQYLSSLVFLQLSNNKISHISYDAFDPLINLKALFMWGNQLKTINFQINSLIELDTLSLSENQIVDFPGDFLKHNKKLAVLYLENNQIRSIPRTTFDGLNDLNYVDLMDNQCVSAVFETRNIHDMKEFLKKNCNQSEQV